MGTLQLQTSYMEQCAAGEAHSADAVSLAARCIVPPHTVQRLSEAFCIWVQSSHADDKKYAHHNVHNGDADKDVVVAACPIKDGAEKQWTHPSCSLRQRRDNAVEGTKVLVAEKLRIHDYHFRQCSGRHGGEAGAGTRWLQAPEPGITPAAEVR